VGEVAGVAELRKLAAQATDLDALAKLVANCEACELCKTRTQTVFSDGSPSSGVLFVGEAPGAEEDAQGVPFVGRAGKFLTRIIEKGMGVDRSEVYIANILKCRPPENRDPRAEEKALCTAWLDRQIELLNPRVIVALGRHAAVHLTGEDRPMGRLRGRVHTAHGRTIVPTYHPSYLIRQEGSSSYVSTKKLVWEDIQLAMREAGIAPKAS
jgi:DNA polymerase